MKDQLGKDKDAEDELTEYSELVFKKLQLITLCVKSKSEFSPAAIFFKHLLKLEIKRLSQTKTGVAPHKVTILKSMDIVFEIQMLVNIGAFFDAHVKYLELARKLHCYLKFDFYFRLLQNSLFCLLTSLGQRRRCGVYGTENLATFLDIFSIDNVKETTIYYKQKRLNDIGIKKQENAYEEALEVFEYYDEKDY